MRTDRHNARTVNQVDTAHQRDVLPHLGLARNRRHIAHLLFLERIDDGAFADIRVANKPDADLLLVRVQHTKLTQKLDKTALTKAVVDRRMECKRRELFRQDFDPSCLNVSIAHKIRGARSCSSVDPCRAQSQSIPWTRDASD